MVFKLKHIAMSVYDDKAQFFHPPFYVRTKQEGIRVFSIAVRDPQSQLSEFPADFKLYHVGNFDDSSGEFETQIPEFISAGGEHIVKMSPRSEDKVENENL